MTRRTLGVVIVGAAMAFSTTARADDVEGTVVGTDAGDLVLDLGATQGARDGMTVEIWRSLKVKHPVTGKVLTDRFLIGRLKLVQVRPALALAQPDGQLLRSPTTGDVVRLSVPSAAKPPVSTFPTTVDAPPAPVAVPPPPADADAESLSALFDSLRGSGPEARARAYDAYVRAHPTSRFAATVSQEAAALRKLAAQGTIASATAPVVVSFVPPKEAYAGASLRIALELRAGSTSAILYARAASPAPFAAIAMQRAGDGYFEAQVPATVVQAPSFEYFIETTGDDGKPLGAVGSPSAPMTVTVDDMPTPYVKVPIQAQFGVWTDFASFSTKHLNDWTSQTEGVFGVRFGDTGVRALRSGFGVYRGVGGAIDELDVQGKDPRSVGLTYGYLETEIAPISLLSFVVRGIGGLGQNGVDGGIQAFVRIGNDLKTNLLLGGEGISGVGLRAIAQLEWSAAPRWPILFRSEVTNQPAGATATNFDPLQASGRAEVGVRLIAQAGFKVTDHLTIALRGSYQGRSINHAGPGAGAAVGYTW